jgi:hypothetical protein
MVVTRENQQSFQIVRRLRPSDYFSWRTMITLQVLGFSFIMILNFIQCVYRVIQNDGRGFIQLVIHNTLERGVCSCTDGSRYSQSFILWCAVCSSYAFLRLERSIYRSDGSGVGPMIRCYSPGHLQMQPHVISFYGVMSGIRFMFLLFPQVSRNWRYNQNRHWNHHCWYATTNELDYRVDVCRITKGAHIEHM